MRSLDSPVLKPALIRLSSARLIGVTAPVQDGDEEQAFAVPLWADVATPEAYVPADPPQAPSPLPQHIEAMAPPAEDDEYRRLVEDADARLRAIEARTADAEARLAETQALLETLEREANLACALAEDARQRAASIREQAQQEGYKAGVERAESDMAERISAVAAVAAGAVHARAEFLQRSESEIIDLVFEIARKVIGQHLALDKEAVAKIAERALSAAGQADVYYLHLHPGDAELVERHLRRDTLGMPLQIVPDDRLCPGDCLVRTAHGRVDACVEAQLREIREQMVGAT